MRDDKTVTQVTLDKPAPLPQVARSSTCPRGHASGASAAASFFMRRVLPADAPLLKS
jgi:hypothetical protein